jgi:hypothetical protein
MSGERLVGTGKPRLMSLNHNGPAFLSDRSQRVIGAPLALRQHRRRCFNRAQG